MASRAELPRQPTLIVGAGLMGRFHAAAARRAGGRVVGVVDPDRAAATALARRWRGATAFGSLDEALGRAPPRIAHVCTPTPTHRGLLEALAAAQVHTFVEKPIVETAAEAEALLARFAAADRFVCTAHQYAFQPCVERATRAAALLGGARRIAFDIRSTGGGAAAGAADTIAADILPHPLAMLQRLLPAADIAAVDWRVTRSAPGDWLVAAEAGGVLISIAISLSARPTCFRTALRCAGGSVEMDNFHGYALVLPDAPGRAGKLLQPFRRGARELATAGANLAARAARGESGYPGLRPLVRRFHAAVRAADATALPITPAEIVAGAIARDRILARVAEAGR